MRNDIHPAFAFHTLKRAFRAKGVYKLAILCIIDTVRTQVRVKNKNEGTIYSSYTDIETPCEDLIVNESMAKAKKNTVTKKISYAELSKLVAATSTAASIAGGITTY